MSSTVERTIKVDKPLGRVWDYLSDFTTTTEWDPGTVLTTRETGDGGVGSTYHNTSSVAGHEVELTYTVKTFEPQAEFTVRGENASLETIDTLRFSGDDQHTVVVYTATFTPKGIAKLATPFLPLGLKKLADKTEDSMHQHLERL